MTGIDLNKPIRYLAASLRFFKPGEHHVTRTCKDDVLLLVYKGVLRFLENGVPCEVHAGEYYIQRHGLYQEGKFASDAPDYLYIHFFAEDPDEDGEILPIRGNFDYPTLRSDMEEMDALAHSNAPYIAKAGKFYQILTALRAKEPEKAMTTELSGYIEKNFCREITLETLCREFHFSKNHIINLFRKNYGMTPIAYLQEQRLQRAEYLMETTSDSLESIALASGFHHYSYFYRLFLRKNGISPEKWREKKRLNAR